MVVRGIAHYTFVSTFNIHETRESFPVRFMMELVKKWSVGK